MHVVFGHLELYVCSVMSCPSCPFPAPPGGVLGPACRTGTGQEIWEYASSPRQGVWNVISLMHLFRCAVLSVPFPAGWYSRLLVAPISSSSLVGVTVRNPGSPLPNWYSRLLVAPVWSPEGTGVWTDTVLFHALTCWSVRIVPLLVPYCRCASYL